MIRPILAHPDPRLRKPSLPVEQFDDALRELVNDMFDTMHHAEGIGLAGEREGVEPKLLQEGFQVAPAVSGPLPGVGMQLEDRGGLPQVYRVATTGGRATRVTFEGNYNARPALSPDGRLLAVVHGEGGRFRIGLYDLETGAFRLLSDGRFDESPSFAPNGRLVIYATAERGTGVLATVSVDARVRQRLALAQGDVREPAWSPYTDVAR
jgi:dipeptidyl aminopeptidase/acylaminoacyl peptidase